MDAAEEKAHADAKQRHLIGMAGQYSGHKKGSVVRKASGHKKGIGNRTRGTKSSVSLRGAAAGVRGGASCASNGSTRLFREPASSSSPSLMALADGGAALAREAISGGPEAAGSGGGGGGEGGRGEMSPSPPLLLPNSAPPIMSSSKAVSKRTAGVTRSARSNIDVVPGGSPREVYDGSEAPGASSGSPLAAETGAAAAAAATIEMGQAAAEHSEAAAERAARVKQLNQKRAALKRAAAAAQPRRTHGWLGLKGNESCSDWRRLYTVLRGARLLAFSEEAVRRCCGARVLRSGAPVDDDRLEESQAEAEFTLSGGATAARMMMMLILRPAGVRQQDDDAEGCWVLCCGSEAEAEQWRASVNDAIDTAKYVERHLAKVKTNMTKVPASPSTAAAAAAESATRTRSRPEL